MKPPSIKSLNSKVQKWNKEVPVGSLVKVFAAMNPRDIYKGIAPTTHEAFVLSGHTAVVNVQGYGIYALDALEALPEAEGISGGSQPYYIGAKH